MQKKKWWSSYPWRQIQTNLREIDMLKMDADVYVNEMLSMNATLAMINTSGIIASYKTKLADHFQSPYLKGDSLKKIIDKCHENNIRVIARTDFSKIRYEIYEKHPEWAYISPEGKPENYNGDIHACICGDYQQEYSLKIIEETLNTLPVDGIFFNMGGFTRSTYSYKKLGICQCESCRKRFWDMFGLELPQIDDDNNPIYRKYKVFRDRIIREQRERTVRLINSIRPDICIDTDNVVTMSGFRRNESNTEYLRPLPKNPYSASINTKTSTGSYPDFISTNTTVDFIGFKYRHIAVSPYQQKLRLWQSLANAGQLDYYLIGRLDNHSDKSGFKGIREVFAFHKNHEDVYVGQKPLAKIALIASEGDEFKGFVRALSLGNYPFNIIEAGRLNNVSLKEYDHILLPDVKSMSDRAIEKLNEFHGKIIATGMTGMYTDEYERRIEQPIKALGIATIDSIDTNMQSAMLRIKDDKNYKTLKGTKVIYFGDDLIFATPTTAKGDLSLIPPHNYGPPERCYWTDENDTPGLYRTTKGAYVPWYPGSLFDREGHTNTLYFIWALLNSYNVKNVTGISNQVEISMTQNGNGDYMIHLVNISGHFGTSFLAPIIMKDLSFIIPQNIKGRAASINGGKVDCQVLTEGTRITLDILNEYEGIIIKGE